MQEVRLHTGDRIALVLGATGLVGTTLIRQLVYSSRYKAVYALSRRDPATPGVEWLPFPAVDASMSATTLVDGFTSVLPVGTDAFSCLGTTRKQAGSAEQFHFVDYELNLAYARAAHKAGYDQFALVSSIGANESSSLLYARTKGGLENQVKAIPFWATHVFQPGLLLGPRTETRWGEQLSAPALKVFGKLLQGELARYRAISSDIVAKSMWRAVADAQEPGIFTYTHREMNGLAAERLS